MAEPGDDLSTPRGESEEEALVPREFSAMDAQEINDKEYNINSTIAVVSTLVLSMTFNIGGTQFSLSGLGVCENNFPDCGSCNNVWFNSWAPGSCATVHTVREIYHCTVYLTAASSIATTLLAVGVIISFQEVPTNCAKDFLSELGPMRKIGQILMYVTSFFFSLNGVLQASLTMEPVTFNLSCLLFVILLGVYLFCRVSFYIKLNKIIDRIDEDKDK